MSKVHCHFCFRIMDIKSFYSKKRVFVPARSIPNPEVSTERDLSPDSDEADFVLESHLVSETEEEFDVLESNSEAKQPFTSLQLPLSL